MLLNIYAGSAVLYRIFHMGLTPNRHAVMGWNVVTLYILARLGWGLVGAWHADWSGALRQQGLYIMVPLLVWSLWIALGVGPWAEAVEG
jgi:hypothetical protein